MCNLYRMTAPVEAVGQLFKAAPAVGANYATEVYPGYPGLVVAGDAVRAMAWGFPLALMGKNGQLLKPRPVNNARTDKLHSPFWRSSFEQRRCLIPVTAWAEAEGAKGHMTRTWLFVPGQETFAVAGVWRPTDEWGDAYSMVMVDGAPQIADIHHRMPAVVAPENWEKWLKGTPHQAFDLCQSWKGRLKAERTSEPWKKV